MTEKKANPYKNAQHQLDIVADRLKLKRGIHELLKFPLRELTVNFPVRMDSGDIRIFTGYRV